MNRTTSFAVATAAALVALPLLAPAATAAPGDPVSVAIVHAIPNTPVDVYVDAARVADDFTLEGANNPLEADLPAGADVQVRIVPGANALDDFTGVLIDETLTIPDTDAISLVAALSPGQTVELLVFEDDVAPTCEGEAGLVVRHAAPIGPVDVYLGADVASSNLAFGEEDGGPVPPGVPLDIAVTLTGEPIGNAVIDESLSVPEGVVTTVYAVAAGTIVAVDLQVGTEPCPTATPTATADIGGPLVVTPAPVPTAVPAGAEPTSPGTLPATVGIALALLVGGAVAVTALRQR